MKTLTVIIEWAAFMFLAIQIAYLFFFSVAGKMVKMCKIKRAGHLRIKLDSLFGDTLLRQSATANLASSTAFQQFFKGIHVAPVNTGQMSGEGAILYFALTGHRSTE